MWLMPIRRLTSILCPMIAVLMLYSCDSRLDSQNMQTAQQEDRVPSEVLREVGQVFQDCEHCPRMIVVPTGTFHMGSPSAEQDWSVEHGRKREYTDRENPLHAVTIDRPFAVGVHEVTRGQFAAFVNETGHATGDHCETFEESDGSYSRVERTPRNWKNPGYSQTDSHPVVCLTWDDAKAYTKWLSEKSTAHYRLLSEAEWEYVARAGTDTYRYWGDDAGNIEGCRYANIADKTPFPNAEKWPREFDCSDGFWMTSPVGSFEPNGFGVYDILGNVWEWVEDCAHDTYDGAPNNGSAWIEDGNCLNRVLRGSALHEGGGFTRSAIRGNYKKEGRISTDGFRVARELD